ncbi:glucosyltransferase [Tilletia horrida]|nr:glucosyltransferase [Tilletia horrida]
MGGNSLRNFLNTSSPFLYALPLATAAALVNHIVPEPYLDEIFHIPQAQAYCQGKWAVWDPKLTTPPGVYLVYVALHHVLLGAVFGFTCDNVAAMRSVNAVFLLCVAQVLQTLIYDIRLVPAKVPPVDSRANRKGSGISHKVVSPENAIRKAIEDPKGSAKEARAAVAKAAEQRSSSSLSKATAFDAHVIAFLPPLWFFGLLYYTDVGSLLTVLVCLRYAKEGSHGRAAFAGLVSLLFRQTNIIWVVFILATSIVEELRRHGLQDPLAKDVTLASIGSTVQTTFSVLCDRKAQVAAVSIAATYSPVIAAFAGFLLWNGSIVLGDKTNHVAALHFPQLLYFAAFTVFFGWPAVLTTAPSIPALLSRTLWNTVGGWRQLLITSVSIAAGLAAVHRFTIEHPFLLADNRHYAFYIWRRVVKVHPYAKYALVPAYIGCARLAWDSIARTRTFVWMLGFSAALTLTLVPSPLLEPRYFLVPYVIWRAHVVPLAENARPEQKKRGSDQRSLAWLGIEAGWYLAINVVTVFVFLYKPFKWPSETGWQRFMW